MQQLSLLDILKNSFQAMSSSKVFMLLVLELIILFVGFIFSKVMNKSLCKKTCIITSLIVLGFYASNYISTLVVFINNVSTRFMEFIYFPTTLEFVFVMLISIIIMIITYLKHKNPLLKFINTVMTVGISYLFFSIIEYINDKNIDFNEFSVFTDPTLTSLYELAMGVFVAWVIGLIIYKIDVYILNRINHVDLVTVDLSKFEDSDIELPKLKESKI